MVTVEKNGILTDIMEVFIDKYLKAGWKITERPKTPADDEAMNIISKSLDSKRAANNRKRDLTSDKQTEAAAIVAQELRKREGKVFTDGLIRE